MYIYILFGDVLGFKVQDVKTFELQMEHDKMDVKPFFLNSTVNKISNSN